jgi:hypothetical protein
MLCVLNALVGSPIIATDGETGSIRNFLFDDQSWKVRYLVVDVGNWLKRHDVVIPVTALEQPDWTNKTFRAHLMKKQMGEWYRELLIAHRYWAWSLGNQAGTTQARLLLFPPVMRERRRADLLDPRLRYSLRVPQSRE